MEEDGEDLTASSGTEIQDEAQRKIITNEGEPETKNDERKSPLPTSRRRSEVAIEEEQEDEEFKFNTNFEDFVQDNIVEEVPLNEEEIHLPDEVNIDDVVIEDVVIEDDVIKDVVIEDVKEESATKSSTVLDAKTEPDEEPSRVGTSTINTQRHKSVTNEGSKNVNKLTAKSGGCIRTGDVIYKAAAPIIQDSTIPLSQRLCQVTKPSASVGGAKGGSNRLVQELICRNLQAYRNKCTRAWEPNPACCVPMRVKHYGKRRPGAKETKPVEEWKIWEERDKERRDHELAKKLGYETLVGNILYINIPNGKDINRSWQNFLSQDTMEWGFPYEKGSIERPRMKQPDPYLAHQVQEILWKYPRSRTFQTTQEEQ